MELGIQRSFKYYRMMLVRHDFAAGLTVFLVALPLCSVSYTHLDVYKRQVQHNVNNQNVSDTLIAVAYDRRFLGYLTISDQIKEDAAQTISLLKNLNVKTTMLSGDKTAVVEEVAKNLGITNYFGDLLPEDKVNKLKAIKSKNESVAFIGDGVNDAPVVALSLSLIHI